VPPGALATDAMLPCEGSAEGDEETLEQPATASPAAAMAAVVRMVFCNPVYLRDIIPPYRRLARNRQRYRDPSPTRKTWQSQKGYKKVSD